MAEGKEHEHPHSGLQRVVEYDFLLECPEEISSEKSVKINFDPSKYGRHYHSDEMEEKINQQWQRQRRTNPRLFNSPRFRLESAVMSSEEKRVEIQLGMCDTKAFYGTNWSRDVNFLVDEGKKFRNSAKFLANALGVAVMIETSDHYVSAVRRSSSAPESPDLIDLPGGYPEPSDCGLALNRVEIVGAPEGKSTTGKDSAASFDPNKYSTLIRSEIYDTVQRVLENELNISGDTLEQPKLLGAIKNIKTSGRLALCFYVRYQHTVDELQKRYSRLGIDKAESHSLITIPSNQILHTNTSEPSVQLQGCKELLSARAIHQKVEASKPKEPVDDGTPEDFKQQNARGRRRSVTVDPKQYEEPETTTVQTDNLSVYAKGCFELWRRARQRKAARSRFTGQFRPSGRFQPVSQE
eukprot:gb/GECG01000409.1/.p1 GENE.gb/GECG01000409.1/~~gb/GECG01000409.1/.p1  ORF type:complete len:410 (+),score=54.12 gb/GECG01000409.1/:1-1230(+)